MARLPVTDIYRIVPTEGETRVFRRKDGNLYSRRGIVMLAERSIKQSEGEAETFHPKGYPDLHTKNGEVGVEQLSGRDIYFIDEECFETFEGWRQRSQDPTDEEYFDTFPRQGPSMSKKTAQRMKKRVIEARKAKTSG